MGSENVIERLTLCNEWGKQFTDLHQPFRICTDPNSGIPKLLLVGSVGSVSRVVSMILPAALLLFTTGADIRRLLEFLAMGRMVGRAKFSAIVLPAELTAVYTGIPGLCGAEIPFETGAVSKAVILVIPPAADEDTMIFHFSGNGRWRTIQRSSDLGERLSENQSTLDKGALRQR